MTLHSRTLSAGMILLAIASSGRAARAAILQVSGQATAQVTQLVHGSVVHTQTVTRSFPSPTSAPAISNVKIDGTDEGGGITSSGQCTAVADDSRTSRPTLPLANNDLGLDLGAFSTDGFTTYQVEGSAQQTRLIRIGPGEVSFPLIGDAQIRSTFSLAGALIVVSTVPNPDLTGLAMEVEFSVVQKRPNAAPTTRLTGTATLTGGPNGQLTFQGTGVVNPFFYPVLNILQLVPGLQDQPFSYLRAVAFPANIFNYTYPVAANEEFELTGAFSARVEIPGDNVGAVAVFGLPENALGEMMARVRGDDSGVRAQDAIATIVDTSGQTGRGLRLPFFGVCGALGVETLGLAGAAALLGARRRVGLRRRRA